MKNVLLSFIAALFLVLICAHPSFAQNHADEAYYKMVDAAAAKDPTDTDWTSLKRAYQDTSFYSPYGAESIWEKMTELGKNASTPEGAKAYQDYLRMHFAHYRAQMHALKLSREPQGSFLKPDPFHLGAFKGLINSVLRSGDGKTCATGLYVIDTAEEYMLMRTYFKVKPHGQSLVNEGGKVCDALSYRDAASGQESKIYFDITKLMATPLR